MASSTSPTRVVGAAGWGILKKEKRSILRDDKEIKRKCSVNEINVIMPYRSILCACDIQDAGDRIAGFAS